MKTMKFTVEIEVQYDCKADLNAAEAKSDFVDYLIDNMGPDEILGDRVVQMFNVDSVRYS